MYGLCVTVMIFLEAAAAYFLFKCPALLLVWVAARACIAYIFRIQKYKDLRLMNALQLF